jgi:hypothetical protein
MVNVRIVIVKHLCCKCYKYFENPIFNLTFMVAWEYLISSIKATISRDISKRGF